LARLAAFIKNEVSNKTSYVKDFLGAMTSAEDMHVFLFNDKQDVKFAWTYPKPPTLVITAKHSSSGANSGAECNGIVSWIEVQKRTLP